MIQELKFLYSTQKLNYKDPRFIETESLQTLMTANSIVVSKALPKKVRVLEKEAFADLILVDYDTPIPLSTGNLPWRLVFGMTGANVDTTIAGGRMVMSNHELLTIDEKEITAKCHDRQPGIAQRL